MLRFFSCVTLFASLAVATIGCSNTPPAKDKMSGDKMGGDKMGGDKMGGDKMGSDKMGNDKK